MKLHRVISLMLLCIYMVAFAGVPISAHWCGGAIVQRSIVLAPSCCCAEAESSVHASSMMCTDDTEDATKTTDQTDDAPESDIPADCCQQTIDIASTHTDTVVNTVGIELPALSSALYEPHNIYADEYRYTAFGSMLLPRDTSPPTPALLSIFRI
jgi:hypothetical protein